ncbi:MAG: hypothetical protein AAF479_07740 [Pseudomonadota bacterium]
MTDQEAKELKAALQTVRSQPHIEMLPEIVVTRIPKLEDLNLVESVKLPGFDRTYRLTDAGRVAAA